MNKSLQILLIDKSKAYSKTDVRRNSANIQILEVNYQFKPEDQVAFHVNAIFLFDKLIRGFCFTRTCAKFTSRKSSE